MRVEASPARRRRLPDEDPRAYGYLERPDDAADQRHGRHVMATDGPRAWQLNGRGRSGLHHVCAARRCRFFATWAPRRCCAVPTTAASRPLWDQDDTTPGKRHRGLESRRLEEEAVAAIAARRDLIVFHCVCADCKCVLTPLEATLEAVCCQILSLVRNQNPLCWMGAKPCAPYMLSARQTWSYERSALAGRGDTNIAHRALPDVVNAGNVESRLL